MDTDAEDEVDECSRAAAEAAGISDLMAVKFISDMEQDDENDRKQGKKRDSEGNDGKRKKKGAAVAATPSTPDSPADLEHFPALVAADPAALSQMRNHKKGDRSPGQPTPGHVRPALPAMPLMTDFPGPALPIPGGMVTQAELNEAEDRAKDAWEARCENEMLAERVDAAEAEWQAKMATYSAIEVQYGVKNEKLYQEAAVLAQGQDTGTATQDRDIQTAVAAEREEEGYQFQRNREAEAEHIAML